MDRLLIVGLACIAAVAAAPSAPTFEPFYGVGEAGREAGDAIEQASGALGPTASNAVHQARQALRTARQSFQIPLPPLAAPAQAVVDAAAPTVEAARAAARRAADFPLEGVRQTISRLRQTVGMAQAPIANLPTFNITVPGLGNLTFPTSFNIPRGFSLPANFNVPTNLTLPEFNGTIPGLPGRFTLVRDAMARVLPPTMSERINAFRENAGQAVEGATNLVRSAPALRSMPGAATNMNPEGGRRPFLGGLRENIVDAASGAEAPSPLASALRNLGNRFRFPTLAQDESTQPMEHESASRISEMPAVGVVSTSYSHPTTSG